MLFSLVRLFSILSIFGFEKRLFGLETLPFCQLLFIFWGNDGVFSILFLLAFVSREKYCGGDESQKREKRVAGWVNG